MEWVLDASLTLAWCFEDQRTPHIDSLLDRLRVQPAIVPQIWSLEVANVLVLAVRRGKINPAQRAGFLEMLAAHSIQTDIHTSELAFGSILIVADQFGLTTYDASYLELAVRTGLPLATLDIQLRTAATKAGVPLL